MRSLPETIRENGEKLRQLNGRIYETYSARDRSTADRKRWEAACAEFHAAFRKLMFPGGEQCWDRFLNGDSSEIESAVAFLEEDPYFFRSGYMKEYIWSRLKRANLTSKQRRRVEQAALRYLEKRLRREFWSMARYVRQCGSDCFWRSVEELAGSGQCKESLKARWLLLARENRPVKNWVHREWLRAQYKPGYTPSYEFCQ